MSEYARQILRETDPGCDGSEDDSVPSEEAQVDVSSDKFVDDVVEKVRKGAGISQRKFSQFALAQDVDDSSRSRRRGRGHHYPEDPAVLKGLKAAEVLREKSLEDGTHFSVRNFIESTDVPAGATHQITNGALEGQYVVIVENGSQGSVKVTIVGGRRSGSPSFIMPKDLRKL